MSHTREAKQHKKIKVFFVTRKNYINEGESNQREAQESKLKWCNNLPDSHVIEEDVVLGAVSEILTDRTHFALCRHAADHCVPRRYVSHATQHRQSRRLSCGQGKDYVYILNYIIFLCTSKYKSNLYVIFWSYNL